MAWAGVELRIVSMAPARPHLVAAGTSTTFVVSTRSTSFGPVTATVRIETAAPGDWHGLLFATDDLFRPVGDGSDRLTLTLGARQTVYLVAQLTSSPRLSDGAAGRAMVGAWLQDKPQDSLELTTRVRNRPKIYYVALDGCSAGYLSLSRKGAPFDGTGERLMPRAWSFASRAALMAKASGLLPSMTDPNHAAALTGSWPGTLGIFSVQRHYLGRDADGQPVKVQGSRGLLRWGPGGQPIQTLFEVTKAGAPEAFTVLASGKSWLGSLYRGEGSGLDLVVGAADQPDYVPPPSRYRFGDPSSDDDPEQDREGTNAWPRAREKLFSIMAQSGGNLPAADPDDRWIAEAVVRVLAAEDPDVVYTNLAQCDTAQHIFGSADRPEEWADPGTPDILWDDVNVFNRSANRDPVLDVVHEADQAFGLILDVLASRKALDRSLVILLSDHGQSTVMHSPRSGLDVGEILQQAGIGETAVEELWVSGQSGAIALSDPAQRGRIEAILEAHEEFHPVREEWVKPFVVVNRDEMDSGFDAAAGQFAEDGVAGNRRGELYSEWCVDAPSTGVPRVRWPDLFLFTRDHFQNARLRSASVAPSKIGAIFNGRHGWRDSLDVMLMISGPGIRPGAYPSRARLIDIAPTLYRLLGATAPAHVDGRVLEEILSR